MDHAAIEPLPAHHHNHRRRCCRIRFAYVRALEAISHCWKRETAFCLKVNRDIATLSMLEALDENVSMSVERPCQSVYDCEGITHGLYGPVQTGTPTTEDALLVAIGHQTAPAAELNLEKRYTNRQAGSHRCRATNYRLAHVWAGDVREQVIRLLIHR